jgi:hypothetical protein
VRMKQPLLLSRSGLWRARAWSGDSGVLSAMACQCSSIMLLCNAFDGARLAVLYVYCGLAPKPPDTMCRPLSANRIRRILMRFRGAELESSEPRALLGSGFEK